MLKTLELKKLIFSVSCGVHMKAGKQMRGEIFSRLIALVILVLGVALGMKSSAEEPTSPEALCIAEIKKSDIAIENSNGNDAIVSAASISAVTQCKTDFSSRQSEVFSYIERRCQSAFSDVDGTTSAAMEAYCQLNGVRFILSLQLQRQR